MTYPLANLFAIQRRFLRNDFTFFDINVVINKTYLKFSVETSTKGKKRSGKSGVGGCPLNARNFNFSARVALGSAKEKLKFGFSGGLFALLFAQTKSKKKVEKK